MRHINLRTHGLFCATAVLALVGVAAPSAPLDAKPKAAKTAAKPVDPALSAKLDADSDAAITAALTNSARSADFVKRDGERHPKAMLAFAGFRPDMHIVEILPGGGYWTEILAAAVREKGKLYVGLPGDINGGGRKSFATTLLKYADKPELYDRVMVSSYQPGNTAPPALAPAGTADLVFVARHLHHLAARGQIDNAMKMYFDALKPGGVLLIEQHRLPESRPQPTEMTGYLKQSDVIAYAEKAGFKLVASSEINANPKDTADHPFGVWTLPPARYTTKDGRGTDPNFDRTKYDAIGESDRMTLKFVKP